ncbi:hypothetical protein F4680DRAFT_446690 [Xylaria scruposa]|nr:hypothetical protein F4680DRAFT_446690 [Xylaria scruposa]
MSVTKTFSAIALDSVLEQIEVQLDGTTNIVKIPSGMFNFMDVEGQAAAKLQASQVLGHKVEFFLDSRCSNRVYLASLANIKKNQPCHARMVPGSNIPTLFPAVLEKKARSPNAFFAYRSHHYLLLKAERPGITFGEISTILGARWKAMTAEQKEPWVQSARAKSEAKRAEESVSEPSSIRGNKRRRIDYDTPESLDENQEVSPYTHNPHTQASQSIHPFGGHQFQSPVSVVPSYTPSNHSFNSSNYTTPESLPRGETINEQNPPRPSTGSLSENPVQSPAYNESAEPEKIQDTVEEYERDEDGILTEDALSKYMQDAGMEPFYLDMSLIN